MKQQKIERLQKNLKSLRTLLDWKTEFLAKYLGLSRQAYHNLEKNTMKECYYDSLIKLLDEEAKKEEYEPLFPMIVRYIKREKINDHEDEVFGAIIEKLVAFKKQGHGLNTMASLKNYSTVIEKNILCCIRELDQADKKFRPRNYASAYFITELPRIMAFSCTSLISEKEKFMVIRELWEHLSEQDMKTAVSCRLSDVPALFCQICYVKHMKKCLVENKFADPNFELDESPKNIISPNNPLTAAYWQVLSDLSLHFVEINNWFINNLYDPEREKQQC